MGSGGPNDAEELVRDVREIWDRNADHWDRTMGEGNRFHNLLIEPAQLELLDLHGGEMILDVACGNGQFARTMADRGAQVVAFDASERMIAHAKARSVAYQGRIVYQVVDCTAVEHLLMLGERGFDHVVCTMALMDIVTIQPLVSASVKLLKAGGCFTFSLLHPCFNSGLAKQGMEQHDLDGTLTQEHFVRVSRYAQPLCIKGLAMADQPVPHHYFHRPLSALMDTFFAEGFVLDGLREPTFGDQADEARLFEKIFQHIPPALVARMRLLND